jgi:hypothetical protein
VHKIKLKPNSPDEEKRKKKRRKIRGSGRKKEIRNDAGRGEKERRNGMVLVVGLVGVTLSGAMSHCLRLRQSSSTALSVIKFIKVNLLFLGFSFESKNEFLDIKNGF